MGLPKGINKARIANMRKSQKERIRRQKTNALARKTLDFMQKIDSSKAKK